ncbi:shikimate dehydrogenase [Candidatus Micrarchaeota archaeon]|nr:shikimate dehydrogenase [Candidatus Micrarchaeota archaeon]
MEGPSSSAKVFAIIGDPVSHSASPAMHNAAFRALGMDAVYCAFRVKKESLPHALDGMRALGIAGMNVTAPHKQDAMRLVDEVDEMACKAGAVNTIVSQGRKLKGFNTDVAGCARALQMLMGRENMAGLEVIVLGAGGAARAALVALGNGNRISIVSRDVQKAIDAMRELGLSRFKAIGWDGIANAVEHADLLVNATPVGLAEGESPIEASLLSPHTRVLDLVYTRGGTKLVRDAKALGINAVDGKEMLLQQAFESFGLFTGMEAPREEMNNALEEWSRDKHQPLDEEKKTGNLWKENEK